MFHTSILLIYYMVVVPCTIMVPWVHTYCIHIRIVTPLWIRWVGAPRDDDATRRDTITSRADDGGGGLFIQRHVFVTPCLRGHTARSFVRSFDARVSF